MRSQRAPGRSDSGFTLIEAIVVMALIGLVAAALAAVFTTVLRATPPAQFRIDDARSTRSLQTWLARDIASTPPNPQSEPEFVTQGGYIFSGTEPSATERCGVADGVNVLHMTWIEDDGSPTTYYANYRLVPRGSAHEVVRYICSSSSPSPNSLRLTGEISGSLCSGARPFSQPVTVGSAVESVELCFVAVEVDTGLNAGGGDTREITLSVSSRNYVEVFSP